MPAAILAGCRRILLHRFRKGVVMLGIGLILALLAVSFIGHNMEHGLFLPDPIGPAFPAAPQRS